MNFLEKSALWFLLVGALIAIAYLLRMPRRREIFPSILILLGMERLDRRERRKLRTFLSFLIIILGFLFITFDSGRPYYSSAEQKERDHILVIDTSASMKAAIAVGDDSKTRFTVSARRAKELIRSLPIGDRMMLMTLGDMAQIVRNFESDLKLLEESLEQVQPQDTRTNWQDAARLLKEVLPTARTPVVHLVTDGSAFAADNWKDLGEDVEWRFYDLGADAGKTACPETKNLAVTNFRARTTFHSDRDFEVIAKIENFTDQQQKVDLDLYLDDVIMDTRHLTIEPRASVTEVFQQTLTVGGVLSGRLMDGEEPYKDALAVDNTAWDVVPSPTRPKVLLFTPEIRKEKGFLEAVFSANSNVLPYRQSMANYSADYAADVYVFYNVTDLPEIPRRDIIFINTRGKQIPIEVQEEFKDPLMKTWNRHHPLMNYLALSNLLIARAQGFRVPGWAETLAETVSGELIVAGETPERQLVYIGLDPTDSDLVFRVDLPMLLSNAVLWMKDRAPDPDPIQPGETYRIQIAEKNVNTLDMVWPAGEKTTFDLDEDGALQVLNTRKVGIYRYQAGEESGTFTVNLSEPPESDLTVSTSLNIGEKEVARFKEEEAAIVKRFWPGLALLALGILIVENGLYHRRILF